MWETLTHWWIAFKASEFSQATVTVPLVETLLLLLALTFCLLFRLSRTGLLLAFLGLYRWGWFIQIHKLTSNPKLQAVFSFSYLALGIIIFLFAISNIWLRRDVDR